MNYKNSSEVYLEMSGKTLCDIDYMNHQSKQRKTDINDNMRYTNKVYVKHGSTTLQQRNYRTATLLLERNCYILCVRVNLKVILSFSYFLIFFYAQTLFGCSFFFDLQLLLNCIFQTVAIMSRCCNVGKPLDRHHYHLHVIHLSATLSSSSLRHSH